MKESIGQRLKRGTLRALVTSVLFVAGVSYAPYLWCSRQASAWYGGDALPRKLSRGVEEWVTRDLSLRDYHAGSSQFNGEWLFGTYMMAGMGYGQMALAHPDHKRHYLGLMEQCIEHLLTADVKAFDRDMWSSDPIDTLDNDRDHHAAFLGYLNLVLGLHRLSDPESAYAGLNDRVTAALVRRLDASRIGLLQSYPFEVYPVDNCAVVGSIGLHGRATGQDYRQLINGWIEKCREKYVDGDSGLLVQSIDPVTGGAVDLARASGTTLGLYMVSFADYAFSRELYDAVRRRQAKSLFGFGGVREYATRGEGGLGDIDSGPVVFGFGLSPTGFMLGGARLHEDRAYFRRLYATAHAWGAPLQRHDRLNFVTGASLGDAIMFAMLTAPKGGLEL